MKRTKTIILENEKISIFIKTLVAIGILTIVPMFHNQMITGPIVNAVLFIVAYLFGIRTAVLIGFLPSVIALSIGLLPGILAPMVPFIILGNIILVISFIYFKEKNYWLRISIASFLKFIFLLLTSSVITNIFLKKQIATKVATMMSWPQLFTALIGGFLAYFFLRGFKKIKNS